MSHGHNSDSGRWRWQVAGALILTGALLLTWMVLRFNRSRLPARMESRAVPRMSFPSTTVSLGEVDAGKTVEASFPFRNSGKSPLKVNGVVGGCGCIVPRYPVSVVAPQAEERISLLFTPLPAWSGPVEKEVLVQSTDPDQPGITLYLKANVRGFARVEPPGAISVKYDPDGVYERTLRVFPRHDRRMRLVSAESDIAVVQPELSQVQPGREYRVRLKIRPGRHVGDFLARVTLHTSDPELPVIPVTVMGLANQGPVLLPREVRFSTLRLDDAGQELARVKVFDRSRPLQVRKVESSNPGLVGEALPSGKEGRWEVALRYVGGWAAGPVQCVVTITTDDPDTPIVTLPVRAVIE